MGEYKAGNTTTRNEIVAVLDQLRDRNAITEKQYIGCNGWLHIVNDYDDDCIQTLCDELEDLAAKYDAGDKSVTPKILICANALVDQGAVTEENCKKFIHDPIAEDY